MNNKLKAWIEARGGVIITKGWDDYAVFSKGNKGLQLKITDNKALDLSGLSAGKGGGYYTAAFVYIEYYTGDKPITE